MHACIQGWSSAHLYASRLQPAPEVAAHLLAQLPRVEPNVVRTRTGVSRCRVDGVYGFQATQTPFMFVDTSGCGLLEDLVNENISKSNPVPFLP